MSKCDLDLISGKGGTLLPSCFNFLLEIHVRSGHEISNIQTDVNDIIHHYVKKNNKFKKFMKCKRPIILENHFFFVVSYFLLPDLKIGYIYLRTVEREFMLEK